MRGVGGVWGWVGGAHGFRVGVGCGGITLITTLGTASSEGNPHAPLQTPLLNMFWNKSHSDLKD